MQQLKYGNLLVIIVVLVYLLVIGYKAWETLQVVRTTDRNIQKVEQTREAWLRGEL